MNFAIIQHKETGIKYLAKPYWLDPSEKWVLYATYEDFKEPKFTKDGLGKNEYRANVNYAGAYQTDKVSVNNRNGITINKTSLTSLIYRNAQLIKKVIEKGELYVNKNDSDYKDLHKLAKNDILTEFTCLTGEFERKFEIVPPIEKYIRENKIIEL